MPKNANANANDNVIDNENETRTTTKNDSDIKSLIDLNKKMFKELKEQKKMIEELQKEQINIATNTEKMCNHINFINKTYDNIKNGYFFKSLFK
jgi:hypothetical protein